MANEAVARCLICGRGPKEHDSGTGLLTCRSIAVPTYRPARTTPNLATAVEDERVEQVAREFVIRVHDHLGKGRIGQASLWSHVYPQFKDELREIANDVANTVVRTRPPTLPDDRDAVIALREALERIRDMPEPSMFQAYNPLVRCKNIAIAALSKHDRNEGGDEHGA